MSNDEAGEGGGKPMRGMGILEAKATDNKWLEAYAFPKVFSFYGDGTNSKPNKAYRALRRILASLQI